MEHTIKKYNLSSVGNNLEIGKRGGMLSYNAQTKSFIFYEDDKTTQANITVADATQPSHAVSLSQMNSAISEGGSSSDLVPYTTIDSSITLAVNKRYLLISDQTLTLPSSSGVNIGDIIILRSTLNITNSSLSVDDTQTELISTSAGTSTSITLDTMTLISLVYVGSGDWELM